MIRIIEFTGRPAILIIEEFGNVFLSFLSTVTWALRPLFRFRVLFKQMEFVGLNSLAVAPVTEISTGMVPVLQTDYGFRRLGGNKLVINIKNPPHVGGFCLF